MRLSSSLIGDRSHLWLGGYHGRRAFSLWCTCSIITQLLTLITLWLRGSEALALECTNAIITQLQALVTLTGAPNALGASRALGATCTTVAAVLVQVLLMEDTKPQRVGESGSQQDCCHQLAYAAGEPLESSCCSLCSRELLVTCHQDSHTASSGASRTELSSDRHDQQVKADLSEMV